MRTNIKWAGLKRRRSLSCEESRRDYANLDKVRS